LRIDSKDTQGKGTTGADLPGLRPGSSVGIVVSIDEVRETVDVRSSSVYDISEKELILAQTDPTVGKDLLGKRVHVTYVAKRGNDTLRCGFSARITDLIEEYRLSSTITTQALFLIQTERPQAYNLRMFHRVEPPRALNLRASVNGQEAIIVDLSIGGIQISHTTPYQFQQGSTVKVGLSIEKHDFKVSGVIRRIWWRSAVRERKTSLEFVAIEFQNMDRKVADLLGKKVREAERLIRLKELFP
jgi:hypothetical protein